MCQELEALRQSVCGYARDFDSGSLIPAQAARIVTLCAAIEASVSTVKSLASAVVAQGGSWKSEGYRSAEEQLADRTGIGTSSARRALQQGRRMADQPEVAQAALAGELSPEQAELVSVGVEADSSKAAELIDKAKHSSMGELRDDVAQVRAASVDLEAQRRRIHAARKLRQFVDIEGVWHLIAAGNVEDGVTMTKLLTPIRQRLDRLRRDRGETRQTFDQLYYDALVALADIACGRDGELTLADLLDLGLFSQLESTLGGLAKDGSPAPSGPPPSLFDDSGPPAGDVRSDESSGVDLLGGVWADGDTPDGDRGGGGPPGGDSRGGVPPGHSAPGDGPSSDDPQSHDLRPGPADVTASAGAAAAAAGDRANPNRSSASGADPAAEPRRTSRKARKLAGRPVQLIIRVDLDTLLRGVPLEGELCEIPGYGPIPVSLIKELMANEAVFVSGLLTKSKAIRGVYRFGRRPNVDQQTALDFLYPGCAVRGCNRKAGLDYDHRRDWRYVHYTVYDLLDRLCWFHHQQKTNCGWGLVDGVGKRDFVPPDDPRHPDAARMTNTRFPAGHAGAER